MPTDLVEYSGLLKSIGPDFLVLECRQVVRIPKEQLDKHRRSLQKGKKVGILVVDGGTDVRVRQPGTYEVSDLTVSFLGCI